MTRSSPRIRASIKPGAVHFEARRDLAIIRLLLDAGPRKAEIAELQVADVAFDLDVIRVLGKIHIHD
jgi:site-specific recombinase XerD